MSVKSNLLYCKFLYGDYHTKDGFGMIVIVMRYTGVHKYISLPN